jgi:hypothetical protein
MLSSAALVLLLLAAASVCSAQQSFSSCHLPTGVPALCVPLAACTWMDTLLKSVSNDLSDDAKSIFKQSFVCNSRDSAGNSNVCCPVEGIALQNLNEPTLQPKGKIHLTYLSNIRKPDNPDNKGPDNKGQ